MEGKITGRSVLGREREPSLVRRDMEILIALSSRLHGNGEMRVLRNVSVEKVLAGQSRGPELESPELKESWVWQYATVIQVFLPQDGDMEGRESIHEC